MLGRISQSRDLAARVRALVDDVSERLGGAPTVLLVISDIGLRAVLERRLRDRGCDVTAVRDAASFHALVCAGIEADVLVVDEALRGASPLHGLSVARRRGVLSPAIALVRVENALTRTEAQRLDLVLCGRSVALGSLDRVLLVALRRLTGRISRAA